MNATLSLTVHYDDATADRSAIAAQLDYAAQHLAEHGLLSGETDLIVDEWSHDIVVSK